MEYLPINKHLSFSLKITCFLILKDINMISSIGLALLIFSISIISPLNDPKCGRLSNGCELKSYNCDDYENQSKCHD